MRQADLFEKQPVDHAWQPTAPVSLDGIDEVYLDTETTGLNWFRGDKPIGIAIAYGRGKNRKQHYYPWDHNGGNLSAETVKRWAKRELRGKRVVGANIKFDTHMLYEWGVDLEEQGCTVGDVLQYSALLDDHRTSFGLDSVATDYLGVGKVTGVDVKRMASYHAGEVEHYARRDVELVGLLLEKMDPLISAQGLNEVRQLEDDTIFPVCEMERNRAPIDVDLLRRWLVESEQEYLRCLMEVARIAGFQVRPDSSKDIARLFTARKLKILHYTTTGKPSFTDGVLAGISDPVIALVRKARKLASIRSKYLLPYADEEYLVNGELRYHLHQLRGDFEKGAGTVTGRFSASERNIQQVMAVEKQKAAFGDKFIIRELFIPRSGRYLSADAMQIEYRFFAHYAASPAVLAAYKADPKTSFHMTVWDIIKPYADIPYKGVKNLNFAKLYGAGIAKIAAMLHVSEEEAKEFVATYDRMFPEVQKLLRQAAQLAEERGYVHTIIGRRARFKRGCKCPPCSTSGPRYHKALNSIIQGSAADEMKKKLVELHRERKHTGFKMRMTVHDEVCGDVPDEESERRVTEILNRQSFKLRVPILWDVHTGANWAEC